MVKLDLKVLRYMTKDEFRVLTAVEMGMKNHDLVPVQLISSIAGLKNGGTYKIIRELLKHKLVRHESKRYDGYRLTYLGYDYLALNTLCNREGKIAAVGNQIGVGKESDIFIGQDDEGEPVVIKFHRLGRTSFRSIKRNRDYLKKRKAASWLYMSRLAALKEYAYMKALYDEGFPVPTPIDCNRHVVLMRLVDGFPLSQVRSIRDPTTLYSDLMNLIVKLASYGLIHCDYNEFNLMVNDESTVTLIDFPQMISTDHLNAEFYFDRDVECVRRFFRKKFGFECDEFPKLNQDTKREHNLDVAVEASGFSMEHENDLFLEIHGGEKQDEEEGEGEEEEEEDEEGFDVDEEAMIAAEQEGEETGESSSSSSSSASGKDVEEVEVEGEEGEEGEEEEEEEEEEFEDRKARKAAREVEKPRNRNERNKKRRQKQAKLTPEQIKEQVKRKLSKQKKEKGHRNRHKNRERRAQKNEIKDSMW